MTMYIGFPSKVDVGVGTGIDLDPFARVSTSEVLSTSSKCSRLSQFLSAADIECFMTNSVLICAVLAYSTIATFSSPLVEETVGVGTAGGAPPVVVGDYGENIVRLMIVGLLIGVAFPKIKGTIWLPSCRVLSNIDCCCWFMWSFMTAMSLTSPVI